MPTVVIDARDTVDSAPRSSARYPSQLIAALRRRAERDDLDLRPLLDGGRGPEVFFEQVRLPRVLRREGADVLHSPNFFMPLRRPCPGVVTIHDLSFEAHPEDFPRVTGMKFRTLVPRVARSADRVICVSEFTRDDVCARYGADPERMRVIYSAPALPKGDGEPPEGPYVLAAGDLRRTKNLVRLIEAFRILHAQGLPHRLILAGVPRGDEGRIRTAAEGVRVELAGYVSDERLDALMRGADLLAHPGLYEGFGLVPVEAMARGCPVAAARAAGLPEACQDAAVYFDPHDAADIASTIRRALDDGELREHLKARGLTRAASFSWDATAARTAEVYRELAA